MIVIPIQGFVDRLTVSDFRSLSLSYENIERVLLGIVPELRLIKLPDGTIQSCCWQLFISNFASRACMNASVSLQLFPLPGRRLEAKAPKARIPAVNDQHE